MYTFTSNRLLRLLEVSKTIRGCTTMPRPRDIFFPGPCHGPHVYPDVNGGHEFLGIVGGYSDLYPDLRGIVHLKATAWYVL